MTIDGSVNAEGHMFPDVIAVTSNAEFDTVVPVVVVLSEAMLGMCPNHMS